MSPAGPSRAALEEALRVLAEEKTRRTGRAWLPLPPADLDAVERTTAPAGRDDDLVDQGARHAAADIEG
jgi:hypothetical protein